MGQLPNAISALWELLGHSDASTNMTYTHMLRLASAPCRPGGGDDRMSNVTSPSAIAELHTNRVRMGHADEDG